jgi:hypothetical protein
LKESAGPSRRPCDPGSSQQFAHQPDGCFLVAATLEQQVEYLDFVIDGAP